MHKNRKIKISNREADKIILVCSVGNKVFLKTKINNQLKQPAEMNKFELLSLFSLLRTAGRHLAQMMQAGEDSQALLDSLGM